MVEFMYFNEEWNNEKTRENSLNETGLVKCYSHADTGEEQKEVYQKAKP